MGSSTSLPRIDPELLKPQGLYKDLLWSDYDIRNLILSRKLSPIYPSRSEKTHPEEDECPICFLYYRGGLNKSNCCGQLLCTECFLKVRAPNENSVTCPFCNKANYDVHYKGPKSSEERRKELAEEQKVIQLQLEMERNQRIEDEKKRIEIAKKNEIRKNEGKIRLEQETKDWNDLIQQEQARAESELPEYWKQYIPDQFASQLYNQEMDLDAMMLEAALKASEEESKTKKINTLQVATIIDLSDDSIIKLDQSVEIIEPKSSIYIDLTDLDDEEQLKRAIDLSLEE